MEGDLKPKKEPAQKRSRRKPATIEQNHASDPAVQVPAGAKSGTGTRKRTTATTRKKPVSSAQPTTGRGSLKGSGPSYEQIELRAYFIGERRHKLGQAGNETSDWVQAERELRQELQAEEQP
jgi:Protein of unknown function (DUF2934)